MHDEADHFVAKGSQKGMDVHQAAGGAPTPPGDPWCPACAKISSGVRLPRFQKAPELERPPAPVVSLQPAQIVIAGASMHHMHSQAALAVPLGWSTSPSTDD